MNDVRRWVEAFPNFQFGFTIPIMDDVIWKEVRLEKMLLGSNAPYLTPPNAMDNAGVVPKSPAYLDYTRDIVCHLVNLPLKDVTYQLNRNCQELYYPPPVN